MAYQGTAILGPALAHTSQMAAYVKAINDSPPDIAALYLEYGPKLGVRGDLAYAQAILETNFFRYTGVVRPEQNNYGGIGATGPDQPGASFATPAEGVLAHLQHLYAYASTEPLPEGVAKIDPRFDLVTRGVATCVGELNGRWAVPGTDYGQSIDRILGEILLTSLPEDAYSITRAYLETTSKNRPGPCDGASCWQGVAGIVIHRTASPSMNARAIRQYFNDSPDGRFASSQFVLDNHEILQLMPVGEVAFHTAGKNQSYLGIETCEHNWGTPEWAETYRKLVWLTADLVRVFQLSVADVTGHFWWDPVNRPYDPTHMTWTPAEGQSGGLFDWNRFVLDVGAAVSLPPVPEPEPEPEPEPSVVGIQIIRPVDCAEGIVIDGTTYVPIRPYTACIAPEVILHWVPGGPAGPRVLAELPSGAPAPAGPASAPLTAAALPPAPAAPVTVAPALAAPAPAAPAAAAPATTPPVTPAGPSGLLRWLAGLVQLLARLFGRKK